MTNFQKQTKVNVLSLLYRIYGIVEPLCEKVMPTCDSSSAFRTIAGVCNNLDNPIWGETNTPLIREILVGDYDSGNFD